MRGLIAHPGFQFWVYKLQGRLTYTHYVPGQLPRKYTLYGYEFKGKLGIEHHYKEGFPEAIYQKSGPWAIPNDGANWCIHPYPHHACNSVTDQQNALTLAPGAPSPQATFKYAQDTAVDTQNTSLGARETPPDVQVTPPDEQETLPDTHSNSQDT
jgi:hypothetical protein